MNKRKYAQLSLSLAAMLMAAPVWAAEANQSAADVVANQTMNIGGKEQIVSQKAMEQARKAQEESGKSLPKKGKDGKYTYYMHNNPAEDISDPNYKNDGTKKSGGRIVEIVPGKGVVREGGSSVEQQDAGSEQGGSTASGPQESGAQAVGDEVVTEDESDGQITAGEHQPAELKEPMVREADGSLRPMTMEERQKWQAEQEQQRTAQQAVETAPQTNAMAQEPVLNMPVAQQMRASEPAAPYIGQLVTKISVKGNKITKAEDIEAVVTTKPGMQLTQEGLAKDLHAIYSLGWYYDLQPEFTKVPEGVQLTYHVLENPVYKQLEVEGNTKISTAEIEKILDLPKDQIINIKDVNIKVQRLEAEYNKQGYILARVADIRMLPDDGTLLLLVNEGIVEDFKVKGNVKTKDYVITREMKLKKGEPFNAKDARRSMQRIYNLGYFEDVNIKLNPGQEPNGVEIEITVVEMNTGTFGIGAGYSNADGFIGMVSVGDRNFRGTGDSVNVRWEFGGEDEKNYELTYVKPWIDDKETKATIVLYDVTNEYADYDIDAHEIARYDKKRRGQELTFSRRTDSEFISNYVTLKNRDDIYKGTADGYEHDRDQYYEEWFNSSGHMKDYYPKTAKERRDENFGLTRSITLGRVFDSRDNIYDPHEGKRIGYSVEWAGLGGDFDFTKFTADWRYYYRAGGECVWALNLGAGWADGDMPLSQRFSMGGSDTLRGYEDDQFRGNSMLKGTLEYRFPIIKKVQGVLFTDNGYAWDKRFQDDFDLGLIKNSFGAGLRINSPLGPVKLDYGWGDDGGMFHFSFGGQF